MSMEKPQAPSQKITEKTERVIERRDFIKKLSLLFAGTLFLGTKAFSQTEQGQETKKIQNPRLEKMPDHNMPEGFERKHVYAELNGAKANIATAFFFEQGKTQAQFISNDLHSECFSPEIDYKKVEELLDKKGENLVLGFAGAYRAPSGNIEGIAYENGVAVGENTYSKWSGFVSIAKDGKLDLYRAKDTQGDFDKQFADSLVAKAQSEGGSLFQQIPAIWNGVQKLSPSSTNLFEMRAICETIDGKKFTINCTEKITQDEFLKMCVDLKDEQGNPAIWNLMLSDTGECSLAVFRDKDQIANDNKTGNFSKYTMVDEQYANSTQGYTNVVVIGKKQ